MDGEHSTESKFGSFTFILLYINQEAVWMQESH